MVVKWPEMTNLEIMVAKQTVISLFLCERKLYGAGKTAFWLCMAVALSEAPGTEMLKCPIATRMPC